MVAEQILISLVYDTGTGVVSQLRNSYACQKAVERAAESTAAEIDGISKADLLGVFEAELDGDALATVDVSATRSELVSALEVRANTRREIAYEAVLDSFLQSVETNLIETGQPEVVSRILYEYARETSALEETLVNELQQRYERYHHDLEALARWSDRLAPDPSSYRLPGTEMHVTLPGGDTVDAAVDDGKNVIVTGSAGVGKSGVLAKRYHEHAETNPVYFLDAREFGQFDSITAVERELGVQTSLREVFSELATQYDQCTLLIDQLDNVRTEPVATVFRNLLLDLADIDGLTVVCACRRWDLKQPVYERLLEGDAFQEVALEQLDESQVRSLLNDLDVDTKGQSPEIIELCRSLLNLSLLADVCTSEESIDMGALSSQVALWDAYRSSLEREGSRTRGAVPQTWDEDPVRRAVRHARSSLRDKSTTFTIDERDPGDQRLVSRGTIIEDWKRQYQFRHDQLQSYFYAWDANERGWSVEEVIADGVDERVAADVFDWMLQFYSEDPVRCTSFVRDGLGSDSPLGFYARYVFAVSARDLGPGRLPEETVAAVVDAVQSDGPLAREFYRDLTSPDWARYLISEERLGACDQFAAAYVARLADEYPDLLLQALAVDEVPSRERLGEYLSATGALDEQDLAAFTDHLVDRLQTVDSDTVQRLERDLCDLVKECLAVGRTKSAVDLISVLAEPMSRETEERDIAGRTTVNVSIASRVRPQTLQSLFDDEGEELVETCGEDLITMLDELLRTCLDHLAAESIDDVAPESAMRRRPTLGGVNPTDIETVLLEALDSSLKHLLETDPATAQEYIQDYRSEGGVFRQTALSALASAPHQARDHVRDILTDPVNVDDSVVSTEFITLLSEGFNVLSTDEQIALLDRILAGPDEVAIREMIADHPSIESDADLEREVRNHVERWQLRRLYQVREMVEDPYHSKIEELVEHHGEIEYSPGSGYHVPIWTGDEQEEDELDVTELDAKEFVAVCIKHARPYQADTEQESVTTGPRDRIKQELYDRIHDNPTGVLSSFPQLVATGDEVFVERIVDAIQSIILNRNYKDTTIDAWKPIVKGLVMFCEHGSPEQAWPRDCRRSVAELLLTIIGHKRSTLPVVEHQADLATILTALLNDKDPDGPTNAWNSPIGNKHSVYVTGVRATSIIATSHFLRVLNGESDSRDHQPLWERLAELRADSARPVRFAFGKQLPLLYKLNEAFVASHLDTLLPEGEDQKELSRFTAVWEGYLTTQQLYPDLFTCLRPKYRHAIDIHLQSIEDERRDKEINDDTATQSGTESQLNKLYGDLAPPPTQTSFDARTFEPLCAHLACAYAESVLDLSDALIKAVLSVDQSDLSAEDPPSADRVFAKTFTDLLTNTSTRECEEKYWKRTLAFWDARLEETGKPVPTAFGQYADVLANAPPTASLDDVVAHLVESAPAMTDSRYNHYVLEFLAAEVKKDDEKTAHDAMTVLAALVNCAHQSYRFTTPDERWTVVTEAAAAGDDRAIRVAERFFEQGEPEYEQVIERYKTDSRTT